MIESNQNPISVDSEHVPCHETVDVHSVPDANLPVKREAWGIVSEKDSGNGEAKTVTEDPEEEEEKTGSDIQKSMSSSIKDSSEISSKVSYSNGVPSSASFADASEKLQGQSSAKEQHQTSLKSQPTADVDETATHEELPKKKRNRRGGRGRKPKASGNGTVNDTREKPEKRSSGDRPNKAMVDQKGGHLKSYDDLKGDALKVSPGAKTPRREHTERRQGESQNLERGAESRPRQVPKQKESPTKDSDNKGPKGSKEDTRTRESYNSPGGSSNESKGGNRNRGWRPPRPQTKSGGSVGEKDDSRKRSSSTPEKGRAKNS